MCMPTECVCFVCVRICCICVYVKVDRDAVPRVSLSIDTYLLPLPDINNDILLRSLSTHILYRDRFHDPLTEPNSFEQLELNFGDIIDFQNIDVYSQNI